MRISPLVVGGEKELVAGAEWRRSRMRTGREGSSSAQRASRPSCVHYGTAASLHQFRTRNDLVKIR